MLDRKGEMGLSGEPRHFPEREYLFSGGYPTYDPQRVKTHLSDILLLSISETLFSQNKSASHCSGGRLCRPTFLSRLVDCLVRLHKD